MRFHILGHISLRIDDRPVKLGPPKARGLLGVLLLSPGALVPVDKIVNALWEEPFDPARTRQPVKGREPPKRPYKAVQIHVTKLRAALKDAGVLVSLRYEHGAYRLTVDQEDVDYYQFRQLVLTAREAAREGDHRRAVDLFQAATALWDGPPLADLRTPWADQQRHDLVVNDLLPAYYRLFEEYQTLGEFSRMISGLRPLLSEYDTDETFARQWMAALAMVNGKDQVRNFYRMFADRLRSTLDEQPSDQLVAFYEQLMRPTSSGTRQTAVGALSTLPEQLPRTAAHFTGRSSALRQLDALVLAQHVSPPIVVIDGAPGIGKTTLVTQWAATRRDHFPDGQLFADLNGYGPGRPHSAVATMHDFLGGMGYALDGIPRTVEECVTLLRRALAGKRVLVVLDNVREAQDIRPVLSAVNACPVLVTSRNQLYGLAVRDGASRISIKTLRSSESITLLARKIGSGRTDQDEEAVRELANLCSDWPLALVVASEHIVARSDAPLAELVAELRAQRQKLLDAGGYGDERTKLRHVFSWSYDALPTSARLLYRRLGWYPGATFAPSAAAAITGLPVTDAEQILDDLVTTHLVDQQGAEKFRMHELLHLFAERLAQDVEPSTERTAALRRMFDYYLGTLRNAVRMIVPNRPEVPALPSSSDVLPQSFASVDEALTWCAAERANVIEIIRCAAANAFNDHAWRLAGQFYEFLRRRSGDLHEQIQVYQTALDCARATESPEGEAGVLTVLGVIHGQLQEYDAAKTYYQRSLAIFQQIGAIEYEATALSSLAYIYIQLDHLSQAVELCTHCLRVFENAGYRFGQANVLGYLADAYQRMGRTNKASNHYQAALRIYEELGELGGQADTLTALGELHVVNNSPATAIGYCEDAIIFYRRIFDERQMARALSVLASAYGALRRWSEAIEYGLKAVQQYQTIGDLRAQARSLETVGHAYAMTDSYDEAHARWHEAWIILRDIGDPHSDAIEDLISGLDIADASMPTPRHGALPDSDERSTPAVIPLDHVSRQGTPPLFRQGEASSS